METWKDLFPEDIRQRYELLNYNHAAEIISQAFQKEFAEIIETLRRVKITKTDIAKSGGNESPIPPKFSAVLDPLGWKEIRISGDLVVHFYPRRGDKKGRFETTPIEQKTLKNYIDGHNIDYVKNRVAIDVEWNSKDQTYDRDLFAMRTYYECDVISAGVIITRRESLNRVFADLGNSIKKKYGASTTWMGKLTPRLDSRRHGGCPILAIGITDKCIEDWEDGND